MNAETAKEDVLTLDPGAAVVYDEPLKLNTLRNDLVFYPVPFDKLVTAGLSRREAAAARPQHDLRRHPGQAPRHRPEADGAGARQAAGASKAKAVTLNQGALKAGCDYAEATFTKQDPFVIEPMNETAGKILIEGNAAAAIGCMMAGVTVVAWYPITPSSSLCESLIGYMKRYRMDKATGKATFAIVQAEDEIASLGMVIGAGWAGARAMTATAGPGISLMSEFAGLAYYAEIPGGHLRRAAGRPVDRPADAHRAGRPPLHGLPVARRHEAHHAHSRRRSRSATTMAQQAFDLAERFQTPVFVMMDLDLGMNNWMSDGVQVSRQADQPRQAAHARRC